MKLRIVTWNIHKAIGGVDRRYRPDRVIEVLRWYRPDIVFLQEVDEGAGRSLFDRQVDLFGDALGLKHRAYGANVRLLRRPGQYGNATLARWPLRDVVNIDLSVRPKKRRGLLFARCRVRVGRHNRTLALFNLHLGLNSLERRVQIRRFLKCHPFARYHPSAPILLGGDFNDVWGSIGRRWLEPRGFRRAGPLAATFPAFLPVRALDGLYLRGDLDVRRCFRSRLAVARQASDHLPIVAVLELRPGPRVLPGAPD
jgi:endonuclease/exonuclease/phosphatase family metal-dependent hydrolase